MLTGSLQQSLSLEILVGLLVDNISLTVLILFLLIWFPGLVELLYFEFFPESHRVLDLGNICKVGSVGDTQASHSMSVSPFCKMALKGLRTLVCVVATNFTV